MLVSSQREVLQGKVLSSLPPTLSTEVDIDITCCLSGLSPLFFFLFSNWAMRVPGNETVSHPPAATTFEVCSLNPRITLQLLLLFQF